MLEIVSASYFSQGFLNLNYQLTSETTPNFRWIVIQNSPKEEDLNKGFEVYPGVPKPEDGKNIFSGSIHHGMALNKAIQYLFVTNRFLLFLDPDFFIIPPLEEVIAHMLEHNLAFYGAPYANSTKNLILDFPVAFCMFVDTYKINIFDENFNFLAGGESDFHPDVGHKLYSYYKENASYDIALPSMNFDGRHTKKTIKKSYAIDVPSPTTEYFWKKGVFGIHTRMKLHDCELNSDIKNKTLYQTKTAYRVVNNIRRIDKTC